MLAMHGLQLGISQASAYPAAMSFDTDAWLERRKLSRRLNWWRFIAVIALLAAGLGGLWWLDPGNVIGRREDHVARLEIAGVIGENPVWARKHKDAGNAPHVMAAIVNESGREREGREG